MSRVRTAYRGLSSHRSLMAMTPAPNTLTAVKLFRDALDFCRDIISQVVLVENTLILRPSRRNYVHSALYVGMQQYTTYRKHLILHWLTVIQQKKGGCLARPGTPAQ